MYIQSALSLLLRSLSSLAPDPDRTVTLSYGTFQGADVGNVSAFLGVPYAQPPLADLRFALPQAPQAFGGVRSATTYGAACLQQTNTTQQGAQLNVSSPTSSVAPSEDCLFINVLKPTSASATAHLPVLIWIYGGAFETGDASSNPGNNIVERSLILEEPIIFVSFNYRLNAFGFLASEEVRQAGLTNIGLRDQRFAMQWVNQHISAFGGDPGKVTIWGQSAGSSSVGLQMVLNKGNPDGLFRAAVMESGSAYALRPISIGQMYYDFLVNYTSCTGQADTLHCLRQAPADKIIAAVDMTPNDGSYTGLNLAWQPRLDGDLFVRNPQRSIQMGQYAKIPLISGDCDDEGTEFSRGNTNITTNAEFLQYVETNYIPVATASNISAVGEAYPDIPSLGSPFDTGNANILAPEFKRISAFTGDWQFQAPRRFTLGVMSRTQNAWAWLYRRGKSTPYIGAGHAFDLPEFFGDVRDHIGVDALINFVTNLDPNAPASTPSNVSLLSGVNWRQWASDPAAPPLLTFQDPVPSFNFTTDTYRAGPMSLLTALSLQLP